MALNAKGMTKAKGLMKAGKMDHSSGWSFSAADGDALLGPENNWEEYAGWFLMAGEGEPKTKEHWKYPFGKNGKVFRSALTAIRQRAGQQHETEIYEAAGKLIEQMDGHMSQAAREAMTVGTAEERDLRFRASELMVEARRADPAGMVWEAVLIEPGLSKSDPPIYWTEEVLRQGLHVFQGIDINAYDLSPGYLGHLKVPLSGELEDIKRYLTQKKVGWARDPEYRAGMGIAATIHFLPDHAWIPRALRAAREAGGQPLGLSIDARISGVPVMAGETTVIVPTEIKSASSVDVVTRPAAGGRFLRAIAGLDKEENRMDRAKLMAIIKKRRPDLLKGKDDAAVAAMSDEEVLALVQQCMVEPEAGSRAAQSQAGMTPEEINAAIKQGLDDERAAMAAERLMDDTLADSGLPANAQKRVRRLFEGKRPDRAALDAAIKDERDYLAAMAQANGLPTPWGDQSRIAVGLDPVRKIQFALDRAMGINKEDMTGFARMERLDGRPVFSDFRAPQAADFDDVPRIGGLREFYVLVSGDHEISGEFNRRALPADLRVCQEITSGTFAYLLGNTLNRRLIKDYNELNGREELLISERKPVKDFRLQEAVMMGYPPDLPDIDPEADDYQDGPDITDEEATYRVTTRGRLLTVTRTTIINDDMGAVRRRVAREGRAARRTHAKYVWGFFVNNSNCSDGTAWFTAGHGNLGASALSHTTALVAYKALGVMTEKDSGERLALLDGLVKPNLVFPIDLMETGEKIANEDFYYTSNDLTTKVPNPLRGKVTAVMVPLLTDANDWGLLLPPSIIDMIEMGYLNGRTEPEMFVADAPDAEHVLRRDRVVYKIRFEFSGTPVDFRSGYKGAVA